MTPTCHKFTELEMAKLRDSPYVAAVGESNVYFTVEFKELFWKMYTEEKMMPTEILRKLGFDPKMLGGGRVRGIPQTLKQEFAKRGAFSEFKPSTKPKGKRTPEQEVERLKAEVEYLRQEREFLKKIVSAGKGGAKK